MGSLPLLVGPEPTREQPIQWNRPGNSQLGHRSFTAGSRPGEERVMAPRSRLRSGRRTAAGGGGPFSAADQERFCATAGGDCDFHCVTLSAMIFIDVMAAWLSDA